MRPRTSECRAATRSMRRPARRSAVRSLASTDVTWTKTRAFEPRGVRGTRVAVRGLAARGRRWVSSFASVAVRVRRRVVAGVAAEASAPTSTAAIATPCLIRILIPVARPRPVPRACWITNPHRPRVQGASLSRNGRGACSLVRRLEEAQLRGRGDETAVGDGGRPVNPDLLVIGTRDHAEKGLPRGILDEDRLVPVLALGADEDLLDASEPEDRAA